MRPVNDGLILCKMLNLSKTAVSCSASNLNDKRSFLDCSKTAEMTGFWATWWRGG